MSGRNWTNETTKMAVIADKAAGVPVRVICERYELDPSTVWRICKKVQQAHPESAVSRGAAAMDLKTRIKSKAINAVESGLDCVDDPYKRGVLGHQVLKEMGTLTELGSDEGIKKFMQGLAGMPEEVQMRYLNPPPLPEPRILSAEDHETWALQVFQNSGMTPEEFNRERTATRNGPGRFMKITNNAELEEFMRAEEVRSRMIGTNRGSFESH